MLKDNQITEEEYDMIPEEYVEGSRRYVAESYLGFKMYVVVTSKFWEENDPFRQFEAHKYMIWYNINADQRGLVNPDDVVYTKCECNFCRENEQAIIREIADAFLKECHDEYVRDQIESGESTPEEMAEACCDSAEASCDSIYRVERRH